MLRIPSEPDFDSLPLVQITAARCLNQSGVRALPLRASRVIALMDDTVYENFDYDVLGPKSRQALRIALEAEGWRARRASLFEHDDYPDVDLIVPKANSILGSNPATPVLTALKHPDAIALTTPTQAALALLHQCGDRWDEAAQAELEFLVLELPANLDKTADWVGDWSLRSLFSQLRPRLEMLQSHGIRERKERSFRSRLPR